MLLVKTEAGCWEQGLQDLERAGTGPDERQSRRSRHAGVLQEGEGVCMSNSPGRVPGQGTWTGEAASMQSSYRVIQC